MATQDQNQKKDQDKKASGPTSTTKGPKSTIKKDSKTDNTRQTNINKGR